MFFSVKNYLEAVDENVLAYEDELRRVRRELHRIPELGKSEVKTQEYILDYLKKLGYKPEKITDTGVFLYIPGSIEGGTVALRSDIDALPIQEKKHEFSSQNDGVMHACGHDGHMSMLLVFAKAIKELAPEHRNLLLIFQPAEEGPGGAEPIVNTGLLDTYGVSEIYGFHLFPFLQEGVLASKPGPMMAMTSEFYIDMKGMAAHAGNPEKSIDTIVAAANLVVELQSVVSRALNPEDSGLLNVGVFESGEAVNIVSGRTKISGTVRSYKKEIQFLLKRRICELIEGIDTGFGTRTTIRFVDMYDPVTNDKVLFDKLKRIEPDLDLLDKIMLAEDFAFYQEKVPGVFIGLGTGSEKYHHDLHTKGFNFNEKVLLRGLDLYLKLATEA